MKKKLLSKSGSKMTSLMKNFQHVDTYIDLQVLLSSINEMRLKEERKRLKEKKEDSIKKNNEGNKSKRNSANSFEKVENINQECLSSSIGQNYDYT